MYPIIAGADYSIMNSALLCVRGVLALRWGCVSPKPAWIRKGRAHGGGHATYVDEGERCTAHPERESLHKPILSST
jgi:hypothetical protein